MTIIIFKLYNLYKENNLQKKPEYISKSNPNFPKVMKRVIVLKDNAMIYEPDPKEIVYLNFNKPFMFIIRDTNTKEVWFVGTVYNPVLWENVQSDYKFQ